MPKLLTLNAILKCAHDGVVANKAGQSLVTIEGRPVLVHNDPESRPIAGCPVAPPMKLCTSTLAVVTGYSDLLRIDGSRVCLDTVMGHTDGVSSGSPEYTVHSPGQDFVAEA